MSMHIYRNFQDMPEETRIKVNEALDALFENRVPGSPWRPIADAINAQFADINFDSEFVRDVYRRRSKRKGQPHRADAPILDLNPDESPPRDYQAELAAVKDVNRNLYSQLVKAKRRTEDLVEATYSGARDAALSLGPIQPTKLYFFDKRHKDSEAALWHMTDWQGGKFTTSYNSEVMKRRVMNFCRKAHMITEIQRADHPVKECLIAFGGDMIEGLFNFPTQAFEIDQTIFDQWVTVSHLIIEVVKYALSIYEHVSVASEWGNHGRIGSKRDNVPRADNIDRMVYEFARQMLANEDRLTWVGTSEDIQRIELGNYRALLIHGDEIGRNGFASPMTILRSANQWRSGAYPWEFRDVYVGHYHTHNEWAMANGTGTVYQSGSTESDNRYARETMAASAVPTQRLHFIDKERGRVSAQYKIYVDD